MAHAAAYPDLLKQACKEIRADQSAAISPAIAYVLAVSPDHNKLAREWIENPNPAIAGAALTACDRELITHEWINRAAGDPSRPSRARSRALGIAGDQGTTLTACCACRSSRADRRLPRRRRTKSRLLSPWSRCCRIRLRSMPWLPSPPTGLAFAARGDSPRRRAVPIRRHIPASSEFRQARRRHPARPPFTRPDSRRRQAKPKPAASAPQLLEAASSAANLGEARSYFKIHAELAWEQPQPYARPRSAARSLEGETKSSIACSASWPCSIRPGKSTPHTWPLAAAARTKSPPHSSFLIMLWIER